MNADQIRRSDDEVTPGEQIGSEAEGYVLYFYPIRALNPIYYQPLPPLKHQEPHLPPLHGPNPGPVVPF